jgi:replicative DNA helicase
MPEAAVSERTLPHNLEAERSVLGAILLHNDAFNLAAEVIDSNDFFRDAHRRIFDKMVKLAERNDAIDLVTLKEELGRSGDLDEVGGPAYISALIDGVPRHTNVEHYAKIIKEKATLRNLIFSANKILATALAGAGRGGLTFSIGRTRVLPSPTTGCAKFVSQAHRAGQPRTIEAALAQELVPGIADPSQSRRDDVRAAAVGT